MPEYCAVNPVNIYICALYNACDFVTIRIHEIHANTRNPKEWSVLIQ